MRWQIGDVVVTKVYESRLDRDLIYEMLQIGPAELDPYRWWMAPYLGPRDELLMDVHAFCVIADGQKIVIDTCVGNDRSFTSDLFASIFNGLDTTFLADLTVAGFGRDSVDAVICTHLHPDHIGYNTLQVDGEWIPTFRNARYILSKEDTETWLSGFDGLGAIGDDSCMAFEHSIQPLIDARQVDLVDPDGYQVTESVSLFRTPGHTPDHFSIRIESRGQTAIITGDSVHSPLQLVRPEWSLLQDGDPVESAMSRHRLVEDAKKHNALVLGTHFPGPTAGHIVNRGDEWLFAGV